MPRVRAAPRPAGGGGLSFFFSSFIFFFSTTLSFLFLMKKTLSLTDWLTLSTFLLLQMPGESGKEDMVVGVADGCMFFQRAGQRAVYSSSRFSAAFCKEHVAAHVVKVFPLLALLCSFVSCHCLITTPRILPHSPKTKRTVAPPALTGCTS